MFVSVSRVLQFFLGCFLSSWFHWFLKEHGPSERSGGLAAGHELNELDSEGEGGTRTAAGHQVPVHNDWILEAKKIEFQKKDRDSFLIGQ